MNFVRAFKYPFHNSAKVLSIVLVLTIAFVVCVAMIAGAHDWTSLLQNLSYGPDLQSFDELEAPGAAAGLGALGLLVVVVLEGFWLNGYSLAVIRSVLDGNDNMPEVNFGKHLRQGFWLFLSTLWYILAACLFCFICLLMYIIAAQLVEVIGMLVGLAISFAAIAFFALAGWGYFVGMARYAVENNRSPLFQIVRNMRTARANLGLGFRLVLYFIALSTIFGIVRSIVEGVLGGFIGSDIVVAAALSAVVYFAFNLFQHFSTQHMIAQYAMAVGVGRDIDADKDKVDFA